MRLPMLLVRDRGLWLGRPCAVTVPGEVALIDCTDSP